jgi:hypothetical protein
VCVFLPLHVSCSLCTWPRASLPAPPASPCPWEEGLIFPKTHHLRKEVPGAMGGSCLYPMPQYDTHCLPDLIPSYLPWELDHSGLSVPPTPKGHQFLWWLHTLLSPQPGIFFPSMPCFLGCLPPLRASQPQFSERSPPPTPP